MSAQEKTKKEPLVSIVVPVYNGGEYFETCLNSILNQTYQNWECIINNNMSEDDSLEVANKFAKKDKRFKVYNNDKFLKMASNWNEGCFKIDKSSKYLKVVGADDWLFPECIEKVVKLMDANPNMGISSSYRIVDRYVDSDGLNIWDGNVFNGKDILYKQLTRQVDISGSNTTVTFAIDHLKRIPRFPKVFDDTTYHEDTELEYELMNISDVGFIYQVLTYTRRHPQSDTATSVFRYYTLYQFDEKVLWEYKGDDKKLNKLYRDCRLRYAYFFFWKTITFDRATIRWHKQYIVRKFKLHEYILGILLKNKFSKFIGKKLRRK